MVKKLPVGIENFEEFRKENFYYIDKTGLIIDLLQNWGKVNLFTRPRRFGKSLNMSMLKCFFEIECDKRLFEGTKIALEKELCNQYMGRFPVISISLKSVDGLRYKDACAALRRVIGREALRFSFLEESDKLLYSEKEIYRALINIEAGSFTMEDELLVDSIHTLSQLLARHFNQKVIILLDEYDVPLDKAFQNGYYDEMLSLIRNLLGNGLKTNNYLQFAVLTGCLRIGKESVFTGLNNFRSNAITETRYDEYFGFTDAEVRELLKYYGLLEHYDKVKEWYDGYRFGNAEIYCPWDVINYCYDACADIAADNGADVGVNTCMRPRNYWINTSGNAMVRRFIDKANRQTKKEIEQLIAGETIIRNINMELTYNELDTSIDNLWSVLFTTGYLTQRGRMEERGYRLAIPNREIRELFISQIQVWFDEVTRADESRLGTFCAAFPAGDAVLIEEMLNAYLWNAISIRDTFVEKGRKEHFYHGMLLGLLQYEDNWLIKSNAESGEGFSDILIETENRTGIVIEVKYAGDGNLEKWCQEALDQIESRHYAARLTDDGMKTIVRYGIAFYKKGCMVRMR